MSGPEGPGAAIAGHAEATDSRGIFDGDELVPHALHGRIRGPKTILEEEQIQAADADHDQQENGDGPRVIQRVQLG